MNMQLQRSVTGVSESVTERYRCSAVSHATTHMDERRSRLGVGWVLWVALAGQVSVRMLNSLGQCVHCRDCTGSQYDRIEEEIPMGNYGCALVPMYCIQLGVSRAQTRPHPHP